MPLGLPDPTTADARERFQKAAETEIRLNTEALAEATALRVANEAMDRLIDALPPPVNAGVKTLTKGIYSALKAKTFPIDIERAKAQMPGVREEDIDPVKLFALMIAFAIIQAIWCFIKSILHPLPIIGRFFSLCDDDPKSIDSNGNLINDDDQLALNKANKDFSQINPPESVSFDIEAIPQPLNIPQPTAGKTFDQFMAEKYPSSSATNQNNSGVPNLVPSAQNAQNNSANINGNIQQTQTPITTELGNLSSDVARRLFGL